MEAVSDRVASTLDELSCPEGAELDSPGQRPGTKADAAQHKAQRAVTPGRRESRPIGPSGPRSTHPVPQACGLGYRVWPLWGRGAGGVPSNATRAQLYQAAGRRYDEMEMRYGAIYRGKRCLSWRFSPWARWSFAARIENQRESVVGRRGGARPGKSPAVRSSGRSGQHRRDALVPAKANRRAVGAGAPPYTNGTNRRRHRFLWNL